VKATYRCDGIDRTTGEPRSEVVDAMTDEDAIACANRIGVMVSEVKQLHRTKPPRVDKPRRGAYEVVFAIAKTLALFAAVAVLLLGGGGSDTVFQQILATAIACFLGILARIFQAEEHSRGVVRLTK